LDINCSYVIRKDEAPSVSYVIETESKGWKVERTFAEVLWLRDQLQKNFPGYLVTLS